MGKYDDKNDYIAYYSELMEHETAKIYDYFNGENNSFNKFKHLRRLVFRVSDIVDPKKGDSDINAYALYRTDEDAIFFTTAFVDILYRVFSSSHIQGNKEIIRYIAFNFILNHEFYHLYSGHCQLSDSRRLAITNTKETNLNNLDFQTMEMDADSWAACKTVEKIIMLKELTNLSESDIVHDCLLAIQGCFFVIRFIERENKITWDGTHPPGLARFIYSLYSMDNYSSEFFKIHLDINKFIERLYVNDMFFMESVNTKFSFGFKSVTELLRNGLLNDRYPLFDGSIDKYFKELEINWQNKIKVELRNVNRIGLAYK